MVRVFRCCLFCSSGRSPFFLISKRAVFISGFLIIQEKHWPKAIFTLLLIYDELTEHICFCDGNINAYGWVAAGGMGSSPNFISVCCYFIYVHNDAGEMMMMIASFMSRSHLKFMSVGVFRFVQKRTLANRAPPP